MAAVRLVQIGNTPWSMVDLNIDPSMAKGAKIGLRIRSQRVV